MVRVKGLICVLGSQVLVSGLYIVLEVLVLECLLSC